MLRALVSLSVLHAIHNAPLFASAQGGAPAWQEDTTLIYKRGSDGSFPRCISAENDVEWSMGTLTVEIGPDVRVIPQGAFRDCSTIRYVKRPRYYHVGHAMTTQLVDETYTVMEDVLTEQPVLNATTGLVVGTKAVNVSTAVQRIRQVSATTNVTTTDEITFPLALVEIEAEAFMNCIALTEFDLGENLTTIGRSAFENTGLRYLPRVNREWDASTNAWLKIGINATRTEYALRHIGPRAFALSRLEDIEALEELRSLEEIGAEAFARTPILRVPQLPPSLSKIGVGAFRNCTSLDHANLGHANITSLPAKLFAGCRKLRAVTMPKQLDDIGISVFEDCAALVAMELPSRLQSLGKRSFFGAAALRTQNFSTLFQLRSIATSTFEGCTSLSSVALPPLTSTLHVAAFARCTALAEIVLPKTLRRIEERVFADCTGIREIALPQELDYIGDHAFQRCTSLSYLTLPKLGYTIGLEAFIGCNLTSAGSIGWSGVQCDTNSRVLESGRIFGGSCWGLRPDSESVAHDPYNYYEQLSGTVGTGVHTCSACKSRDGAD